MKFFLYIALLLQTEVVIAQADHRDTTRIRQEHVDHPGRPAEESPIRTYRYGRKSQVYDETNCGYELRREMVGFVNWKISSDNASGKYSVKRVSVNSIAWDSADYSLIQSLDTLFAQADIQYLKNQIQCYLHEQLSWRKKDFKNSQVIKPGHWSDWKKTEAYWSYSLPIFLPDQAYCMLKYSYTCGELCGTHYTGLFKRTKDGWVEVMEWQRSKL